MIKVLRVERFSPNTNDTRMVYELFADTKAEVVPGASVEGLTGDIPVGTKLVTASGEVARMTSTGEWTWGGPEEPGFSFYRLEWVGSKHRLKDASYENVLNDCAKGKIPVLYYPALSPNKFPTMVLVCSGVDGIFMEFQHNEEVMHIWKLDTDSTLKAVNTCCFLPKVNSDDNGKTLKVVSGRWVAVEPQ